MSEFNDFVESLKTFISSYPNKFEKKDLLEAIKIIYSNDNNDNKKESKKTKGREANVAPRGNKTVKREPTEYNKFMRDEMKKLKDENSELSGKQKMELIAQKWKEQKSTKEESKEEKEEKE